jgi:hypothetical protein
MTGQCCVSRSASVRLARRLSALTASILPGAALILLPKCPLCLAVWLTALTGLGFSADGVTWVSGILVLFSVAAVAVAAVPAVRRRALRRTQAELGARVVEASLS